MKISPGEFRRLCQNHSDRTAKALLKSMREFGYEDLTLEEVEVAMKKALSGKEDEVISIWIKKYLQEGIS